MKTSIWELRNLVEFLYEMLAISNNREDFVRKVEYGAEPGLTYDGIIRMRKWYDKHKVN